MATLRLCCPVQKARKFGVYNSKHKKKTKNFCFDCLLLKKPV